MKKFSELTDREIDALVAEHVMGWDNIAQNMRQLPWSPSTNIADAWKVVELLIEKSGFVSGDGYAIEFQLAITKKNCDEKTFMVELYDRWDSSKKSGYWSLDDGHIIVFSDKAPRAICHAALKIREVVE